MVRPVRIARQESTLFQLAHNFAYCVQRDYFKTMLGVLVVKIAELASIQNQLPNPLANLVQQANINGKLDKTFVSSVHLVIIRMK